MARGEENCQKVTSIRNISNQNAKQKKDITSKRTKLGCEFHFRDSVNRKAKLFGELKEKFVAEVLPILTATTPEEYHAAQHQFKLFLSNEALSVDVSSWLD